MNKITINDTLRKEIVKTEFWIGLMTVILLVGVVGIMGFKEIKKYQANSKQSAKIISPIPEVKITIIPTATAKPKLAQIKKLANTDMTITAENNDTFWSISKRYCGNGKYFATIEELNGYKNIKLQPGDQIVVYCY